MLRFAEQTGTFGAGILLAAQGAFPFFGGVITGTGVVQADTAVVDGAGFRGVNATGTPPDFDSQDATVEGTGEVSRIGEGALAAQAAAADGAGKRGLTASGALVAGNAEVAGFGQVGDVIEGSGGPQGQPAQVDGVGERSVEGLAEIAAQSAQTVGIGVVDPLTLLGIGTAAAQAAQIEGAGFVDRQGVGVLQAQNATIEVMAYAGGPIECFMRTREITVDLPTVVWDLKLQFTKRGQAKTDYVHTDAKALQIFFDGVPKPYHIAYRFSNKREFLKFDE